MLPAKLRVISYRNHAQKAHHHRGDLRVAGRRVPGGVAVFILKARKPRPLRFKSEVQSVSAPAATPPPQRLSFANLSESAFRDATKSLGNEEYFITLYADHTFMDKSGRIHPKHGWYLTPEALVLKWISNETRFDRIEDPASIADRKASAADVSWKNSPRTRVTC